MKHRVYTSHLHNPNFKKQCLVLAALIVTALSPTTHATSFVDTTTGYTWRSLADTSGMSLDQVTAQLSTTFSGYSVASIAQIDQLVYDRVGVQPLTGQNDTNIVYNDPNFMSLTTDLGLPSQTMNYAFTSDVVTGAMLPTNYVYWFSTHPAFSGVSSWHSDVTSSTSPFGVMLVDTSTAAVPLPATLFMFVPGLLSIMGFSNLKKKSRTLG